MNIMKSKILSTILVLTSMLFYSFSSYADNENIRFQRMALEEGLSQEYVLTAFQDSEGFMWFGTQEGLNRFDGYQFKVFTSSTRNNDSLSSEWIHSIIEYDSDTLWIGTLVGINIFDKPTQTFKHKKNVENVQGSLKNNTVRILFKDSNGGVWVGTDAGLDYYNKQKDEFEHVQLPESAQIPQIHSIIEDESGQIFVGTYGIGVVRVDPNTREATRLIIRLGDPANSQVNSVRSLLFDSEQKLWVGTSQKGLAVVEIKQQNQQHHVVGLWQPEQLNGLSIAHIYQDRDEKIWVATDNGLFRLMENGERFLHINHEQQNPYSLSGPKLTYLYQDRGNVFWVGSYSGLNKWNMATANFDHIRVSADKSKSLGASYTTGFADGPGNKIWISSLGGVDLLDLETRNVTHLAVGGDPETTLRSTNVTALHAHGEESLWIGYRDRGLSKLDIKSMTYTHYSSVADDPSSLGANGVTTIKDAGYNKLWIGTYGGGLNLFDMETEKFTRYVYDANNQQTLSSSRVLSVEKMDNGLLWVGTWGGGLNIFNPTTSTAMRIPVDLEDPKSIGNDVIYVIHEDQFNNMWIGTGGAGLAKLSADNRIIGNFEFEKISRYEGLPSNVVYGIVEDQQGFLWVSTNRGISKVDPATGELINYDSSHGLQGNEFNSGAFYKSRDNKLFFGGSNGVTSFYPERISPNQHVPPVVLTKFQKLNEVVSLDSSNGRNNKIQISHKDYLIAFEFAGLDFASPNNNRYLYKLEGFDSDWIEARDIRKATYTNLPAGNYLFKVKASNNDGIWNEQGADVSLTVLPAPWYSWWAYVIYTAIILALIYWMYRSYLRKLERDANYRHELELEVESRTVELQEVNQQLMSASVTDQLTGLHNRRYLNNIVEQQCASVFREFEGTMVAGKANAQSGPRLFFLMFDLDGFKPINDNYGHDAGDKVICQVSELLRIVCRKSDTVIRWGGDEFLVMGKVEEAEEVQLLAERLRSKIASFGFDIDLKQKMHLSCSIGYSLYPFSHHYPDSLSWEQVHLLADNALYKSKESGRNQWTGMLQSEEMPPLNIINTLSKNIETAIEEGYVKVTQASRDKAAKVSNITRRR